MASLLNLEGLGQKLDQFLYRRAFRSITPSDLDLGEKWALAVIRKSHPDWNEDKIRAYYDSLLRIRVVVCDEAGRPIR